MASTDDQILMDKMVSERNYVLPERSKREAQITGDLETSMVDAAYSVGEPDMRSLVMDDKVRLQDDESGFFDQFYGSLESTIFQDNPRLSGRAIEGMGRVTGIDAMREFGENIVADYEASPDKGSFVPRVSTYEDVDGLNAALDYMGSTIGQGAGSIAMTVGGAVAGAGLGAAGGAAVGAVGGGVGSVPGAALGAVAGGATGGAVAASFLLNYGDTYEYLMEQEGVDPDKAAELALVPGTIMAGLDAWGVGKILGPAKGKLSSNIIKRTGQLAVRGAGTEGVTEAGQQVIQESTGEIAEALGYATEDIEFSQRVKNSLNALIAGTLTGGAMSGATSPFKKGTEAPPPPPSEGTEQDAFPIGGRPPGARRNTVMGYGQTEAPGEYVESLRPDVDPGFRDPTDAEIRERMDLDPVEAAPVAVEPFSEFDEEAFNLEQEQLALAEAEAQGFDTIEDYEARRKAESGPVYLQHSGPRLEGAYTDSGRQDFNPPTRLHRGPPLQFTEAAETRRERQRDLADRGLMIERRKLLREEYGFTEAESILAAVMSDEEVTQYIQDNPVFRGFEGIGELESVVRLPEGYEADPYDGPLYSIIKKGTDSWEAAMEGDSPKKVAEDWGITKTKIDPSRSFPGGEKAPEVAARSVPTETAETTEAVETTEGVVEEAGKFEVNMAQMAARLGQSMYAGNLSQVVIKEGIQNSFDAIKAMQSKGVGSSQIHIIVNDDARTIEIVDDGSGMTLDIVKKAFLTLGGTHKEDTSAENSSGGHGMAKMAFLLGPERFQLDTVREGKRILIDATPLEIMNNDFKIKIEDGQPVVTDEQASYAVREMGDVEGHGTKITVKIPKTYTNPRTGEQEGVSMPYTFSGFLKEPLIGNVEVRYSEASTNYDSDDNPTGVTVDPPTILDMGSNLDLSTYKKYTTVEFDWGRADLYIEDDRAAYPKAKVLSSGLFQFEAGYALGLSSGRGFPYNIIVDIKSSVRSGESPLYPFNNSREGFSAPINKDVEALGQYILSIGNARDAEATAETFANAVSMERIGMEDVGGSFADARKAMLDSFADERRQADVAALEMEQEQEQISVTRIDANAKKIIEIMRDGSKREKDYGKPKLEADKKPSMVAKDILDTSRSGEGFGDLDPSKPLFHNNTNIDYIAALNELPESERPTSAEEFFTELGSIVVEFREVCAESLSKQGGAAYKELNNPEATYASGISIDKDYHGVHVRAPYRAFFLNPLPMSVYRITHPYSAMESSLHTLLHEVTHVTQGGHNESFTSEIFDNYTRLAESGHMEAFRNALKEVYGKHWKTFNSLRKIYGKHSTQNIGKSLEGSESRVRQGQGSTGIDGESVGDSPDVVSAEGYGQSNIGRSTSADPRPPRGSTEASAILASRVIEGLQKKK